MAENRNAKKMEESAVKRRRKQVLLILSEIIVCLLLGIGVYLVMTLKPQAIVELDSGIYVESGGGVRKETIYKTDDNGKTYAEEIDIPITSNIENYRNILILGLDEQRSNTDVILIASINNETGNVKLISILRDTLIKFEENTKSQPYGRVNSQYVSGISQTISMINRNFGLNIREYAIIDWYSVATCINQLGGIDLELPANEKFIAEFNGYLTAVNDNTGIWAPQIWEPGVYHMSGTQVVAYCRIRHVGTDLARTARQRVAISKIVEQAKAIAKAGDFGTLIKVAQTGMGNVVTNLKLPDIMYLATNVGNYSVSETRQFPQNLASSGVANIAAKYNCPDILVAADFAGEVREMHAFLFEEYDYVPSDFVKKISAQMYNDRMGN